MKHIVIVILVVLSVSSNIYAQKLDEEGYRFMKRIRGMQIPDSKVQEIMVYEKNENLVVSFRANKVIYIQIIKLYSWDVVKEIRIDQGVELYTSYFSEDGKIFYANTDIYKQLYIKIDLVTDKQESILCAETPRGCVQVESKMYSLRVSTTDKSWLIVRDVEHENDVLTYFDLVQFNQVKSEMEAALQREIVIREVKESMEQEARTNQKAGMSGIATKKMEKPQQTTTKTLTPSVELSAEDVMKLIETGSISVGGTKVKLSDDAKKLVQNPTLKSVLKGNSEPKTIVDNRDYSVGEVISLNNILFEQGKSAIMAQSYPELDKLVTLLSSKTSLKIQVNGHTNNIGVKNLEISQDRAKAVVDYLISKGIDAGRLAYKGFGDTQPIADNNTEEGRTKNRRVEFIIVSQ